MFYLSPVYSARKSSNHKLSKNHKISPDTNLQNIEHKIFEELVYSIFGVTSVKKKKKSLYKASMVKNYLWIISAKMMDVLRLSQNCSCTKSKPEAIYSSFFFFFFFFFLLQKLAVIVWTVSDFDISGEVLVGPEIPLELGKRGREPISQTTDHWVTTITLLHYYYTIIYTVCQAVNAIHHITTPHINQLIPSIPWIHTQIYHVQACTADGHAVCWYYKILNSVTDTDPDSSLLTADTELIWILWLWTCISMQDKDEIHWSSMVNIFY